MSPLALALLIGFASALLASAWLIDSGRLGASLAAMGLAFALLLSAAFTDAPTATQPAPLPCYISAAPAVLAPRPRADAPVLAPDRRQHPPGVL